MPFASLPVTSYLAKSGVWATSLSSLSGLVLIRLDSRQSALGDSIRVSLLRKDARSDRGSDAGRLSGEEDIDVYRAHVVMTSLEGGCEWTRRFIEVVDINFGCQSNVVGVGLEDHDTLASLFERPVECLRKTCRRCRSTSCATTRSDMTIVKK
jgi:hypothetical protein